MQGRPCPQELQQVVLLVVQVQVWGLLQGRGQGLVQGQALGQGLGRLAGLGQERVLGQELEQELELVWELQPVQLLSH